MAVPPTPDGAVGPSATSARPIVPVLAAVLAVVCVACLVFLGMRYAGASGSVGDRAGAVFGGGSGGAAAGGADDPRTRELVLSQANQFILRVNTYGPSDLDKQNKMPGYVSRVKEVISPKLDVEFQKSVALAEQSVAQTGLERSAQLYASGLESIGDDVATVLVTGAITQSYPDPQKDGRIEFEPELFRYQVSMVKTGGKWLADDFDPVVGGEDDSTDGPGGTPTAPATVDPSGSGDPSAAPSSGAAGGSSASQARLVRVVEGRRQAVETAVTRLDSCGYPGSPRGGATCAGAPDALGAAARSLATGLRDAVAQEAAPASIAGLVQATRQIAGDVSTAASTLNPTCLTSTSAGCTEQRTTITENAADLLTALDGWESLR